MFFGSTIFYINFFNNIDRAIAKKKDEDVFKGLEQNFVDIRVVNNSNDKSEIIKSEEGIFVSDKAAIK